MPFLIPAAIVAAGVGGALISGGAAKSAAKSAANAAQSNNALQGQIYDSNKAIEQPAVDRGNAAGANINALLGLGGNPQAASNAFNQYQGSDGYQFRVDQGTKALNTGYAAHGLIQSGAAMKGIQAYGQGQASDEFGKYLGYLGGQQSNGLAAGNALAGVGNGYANAVGANNNSAASASGNASLAAAGQVNGALNNGVNALALYQGMGSSYGGTQNAYGIKGSGGTY